MPDIKDITDEISRTARDAAYVVVGLGVLGFQRAQVRRQELNKRLAEPRAQVETALEDVRHELSRRVKDADGRLEQAINRLESTWEPVEQRLPAQARSLLEQARSQAREARQQLRSLLVTPAA
jgi:septal ring factor EnvC (AmiA/AmiB activator)